MERARLAESLRSAPACTAEAIVHDMRQELCADHAGITLIRGRRLETVTSTDGLVA
jgi:hypothetical protein